ncbi:MAG TPA: acylphosphatase [Aggregatilineales bacterium]|nr:acylphosphatase [Anaerolineales bacterium]HRE48454.1 acylphosphatase [Aggregatilineales bacterium]
MPTISVRVEGIVQGVGYRAWTRTQATRLKLTGWVSNLSDGGVAITATGSPDALGDFTQRLWRGPANAMVKNVVITPHETESSFASFEIRYT